jgi:nucleoside-diphosphate-sugar epimerase
MPDVLIAGCGYVGIAAAKLFHENGWNVTAWTRSGIVADPELGGTITNRAVDLRDLDQVRQNSFPYDLVAHCASSAGGAPDDYRRIYRDGAANLATCLPQTLLFFTSSTSVYGQSDGNWVDEDSPAEPVTEKGKILREAEEIVLARGGIVLRLAGIYGPGRSFFVRTVRAGTAFTSPAADRYVNQVHRDDVASALFFLGAQMPVAAPAIFNVVDDKPAPRSEILKWLSGQLQIPLRDSAPKVPPKRADSNKRVSNRRLRSLGWSPIYPSYKEGLLNSVLAAGSQL